jgi:hypothetical protein
MARCHALYVDAQICSDCGASLETDCCDHCHVILPPPLGPMTTVNRLHQEALRTAIDGNAPQIADEHARRVQEEELPDEDF